MNSAEAYLEEARAMVEKVEAPVGNPSPEPAPQPVLVPVGEIPLRLLEFRRGHKTTELGAVGLGSALLGVAALWCGLPVDVWAYCQTALAGVYIHSRGMAKQRRR